MKLASKINQTNFGILLGFFGTLVTASILPVQTLDPVNPIKLFGLTLIAVVSAAKLIRKSLTSDGMTNYLTITCSLFLIASFVSLLANHEVFSERLFGIFGRNTGFITFLSLGIVLLAVIEFQKNIDLNHMLFFLMLSASLVMIYFVLQINNLDPFKYTETYDVSSSTLGNPNFISGFVGFSAVSFFSLILVARSKATKIIAFCFGLLGIGTSIYVLFETKSVQGFFSLGISGLVILGLATFNVYESSKSVFTKKLIAIVSFILVFCLLISSILISPRILNDQSVIVRRDYWYAGLLMIIKNIFLGVGFDSFGDKYRAYRSAEAFNRFDNGFLVTDSPHNSVIEIGLNGGIPLLISYAVIQTLVFYGIIFQVRQRNKFSAQQILVISCWLGFQVQSLVSVTQIAVALWGWILTGLAIVSVRPWESFVNCKKFQIKSRFIFLQKTLKYCTSILLIISLSFPIFSGWYLRNEMDFYSAAIATDGLKLKEINYRWPFSTHRTWLTSQAFANAGYNPLALEIAKFGVGQNSDSYLLWKIISENPISSEDLQAQANVELMRIEPRR